MTPHNHVLPALSAHLSLYGVLVDEHVLEAGEAVVDALASLLLHDGLADLPDLAHRLGRLRRAALHRSRNFGQDLRKVVEIRSRLARDLLERLARDCAGLAIYREDTLKTGRRQS